MALLVSLQKFIHAQNTDLRFGRYLFPGFSEINYLVYLRLVHVLSALDRE